MVKAARKCGNFGALVSAAVRYAATSETAPLIDRRSALRVGVGVGWLRLLGAVTQTQTQSRTLTVLARGMVREEPTDCVQCFGCSARRQPSLLLTSTIGSVRLTAAPLTADAVASLSSARVPLLAPSLPLARSPSVPLSSDWRCVVLAGKRCQDADWWLGSKEASSGRLALTK